MKVTTIDIRKHGWELALLAALGCMFAYLLSRNLGLHPAIFADEWYYSKFSRLSPLKEAIVPSYLYLWLFRATNACGDGFLDCTRIINALFFVGAAPFIYLIARPITGKALAWVVALLCMLAPVNVYTAYFMPEAMYYFGFCVLSWIALTRADWGWARRALAGGAVLGLMSLVKVHAVFLLPALCLFALFAAWNANKGGRWLRIGLLSAALTATAMLAVRFGVGYAIAGEAGLHLFGSFYSVTANSTAHRSVFTLLAPAFINGRGHLQALAVLLALPLAILAHMLLSRRARVRASAELNQLQLYTFLMLGSAVGLTVMYTASIAGYGPIEVVRLHLRYYTFVFPLLFILGAAPMLKASAADGERSALRWVIALALCAVLVVALLKLPHYSLNPIDGPEIASLDLNSLYGRLVVGLDVLILLLWARNSRLAAPLFLFVALPATLYCANDGINAYLRQLVPGWEPDRAGQFAHRYIPRAEHKYITVAGTELQNLMRVQFHIDDKDVALLELPKDGPIEAYQLPVTNKWLLVFGNHALPPGIKPLVATSEYALVRLNSDTRRVGHAALSAPFGAGLIARAEGLSHAESWGRWSEEKQVVLHFSQPLPKNANVILKAQAFDVNATLPFTMRVGDQTASFRLSSVPSEIGLRFNTDGKQRSLVIEVPRPIAPSELGQPNDDRTLGIGISAIEIGTVGGAP